MGSTVGQGASQRRSTMLRGQDELALRAPQARELSEEYQVERARECSSFGMSLVTCATAAGLEFDKEVSIPLGFDKGQLSRWQSNGEGVREERLLRLQQWCGNWIPMLYLAERCGFDGGSMRRRMTELERENRRLRELLAAARTLLVGEATQP